MNILVINGSPKGKYSITIQTVLYLKKRFPEHSFRELQVGQRIRYYENDMSGALKLMNDADVLLFSYPVYTFLAPSQLARFVELLKREAPDLTGKYASQITTSKHFYDMTAHRYIEDNCRDLGLKVIHGLSADMEDLLSEQGQKDAGAFMKYLSYCVTNDIYEKAPAKRETIETPEYKASAAAAPRQKGFDTVLVADVREEDETLKEMIADFKAFYPYPVREVNIAEFPFAGGCLGCFRCAADGKCVYKDGFDSFLREKIQTADAIVYAFAIRDHSMGARFKMYDDRQFCNGHRTVTAGKPCAYITAGDFENEPNLRTVIEARAEVGHNFLAGVGYDKETIESAAGKLCYALENHYEKPRNFYGVGGMKIFRDLIWVTRGLMKADHEFYKKRGLYDFPQKKFGQMLLLSALGAMVRNPKILAKMGNKMNEGMVAPYRKVVEKQRDRA